MSIDFWIQASLWLPQFFYLACFIPQIFTNYHEKSGHGVSSLLLIGYLNAYLFLLFYVFFIDLPLAYKFMVPLQTLATMILIIQQIYYDAGSSSKKCWVAFGANLAVFALCLPYAFANPLIIGMLFGWMNLIISIIYQLPQIFKIYQEKSVAGFNFLFVLFTGIGAIIELSVSMLIYLPPQTRVSALRAILLCLIFCWQFHNYKS